MSDPATPKQAKQAGRATQGSPVRKGERTAERILDAAEALFAENGYAGTTLRDVAASVGLRNPSLYNHFPSKESLYGAVLEREMSPVLEILGEFANSSEADRQPRELVERVMKFLADSPNLPRLVMHETLAGGGRLTPELRGWIGPIFEKGLQAAGESAAGARWDREQVPLLVLAIYNIIVGYFAIAPFYRELNDRDLADESMRGRQTQFVADLVELLFSPTPE